MLGFTTSKIAPVAARSMMRVMAPRAGAVRFLAAPTPAPNAPPTAPTDKPKEPWEEEGVVLAKIEDSLEWTLSSPPPIHQFDEPPIVVEISEA